MRATTEASIEVGHAVVVFEDLVLGVERTLVRLSEILGLEYETGMATPAISQGVLFWRTRGHVVALAER